MSTRAKKRAKKPVAKKAKAASKPALRKPVRARRPRTEVAFVWSTGKSFKPAKTVAVERRASVSFASPLMASLAAPMGEAAVFKAATAADAAAIPVDFTLKIASPAANIAPALRVEANGTSTDVPLSTGDGETWSGGISAAAGTDLQIFAVSRVKSGGSMTLSIKEPGFSFPPIRTDPVNGLCAMGPLPYRVG